MRRLALLLALALAACAPQPADSAIGESGPGGEDWPRVGPQSLAKWASFPVDADPRPLVLLGEPVNVEKGFTDGDGKAAFLDGRIDPNGKVPPEAAEAFAKLAKPNAGTPKIKVISAELGTAKFGTDRGPRELPAWIFQLTETLGPVTVLAVKPDYQAGYAMSGAKVSADGMTLTVAMAKAVEPCPGEPRVTYEPEWLESTTAVAVGLRNQTGPVAPGVKGNCAHDLAYRTADYTIKLSKPLGSRVLADASGNAMPVTVSS
jgi:hypothetical protein